MKNIITVNFVFYISSITVPIALAEVTNDSASASLNRFTFNFFADVCNNIPNENIVLSPYTVWNVMSIIKDAARGNSSKELEDTLGIPSSGTERDEFRTLQQELVHNITQSDQGISLDVFNGIFPRLEAKVNLDFQTLVRNVYNAEVQPLDFKNSSVAAQYINQKLYNATKGRINNVISEESVRNAEMYITSALYFKGIWDKKFYTKATEPRPFYNGLRQEIAKVPTMFTTGVFPSAVVLDNKADAIKLPYIGGRLSMILLVPTKNANLTTVLQALSDTPIAMIVDKLKINTFKDELDLYLPKFKISSSLSVADVLQRMGIIDIFTKERANLTGMSPDELYVSNVLHEAEIEVDEEGTEGSSLTLADIVLHSATPEYHVDSPFAFVIFDEKTQSVIFTGKVTNPAL